MSAVLAFSSRITALLLTSLCVHHVAAPKKTAEYEVKRSEAVERQQKALNDGALNFLKREEEDKHRQHVRIGISIPNGCH